RGSSLIVRRYHRFVDGIDEESGFEVCFEWRSGRSEWQYSSAETFEEAFSDAQEHARSFAAETAYERITDRYFHGLMWTEGPYLSDYSDGEFEAYFTGMARVMYYNHAVLPQWITHMITFEEFVEWLRDTTKFDELQSPRDKLRTKQQLYS